MRYNASQGIVSLKKVVFDRNSNLFKYEALGVNNLKNFQHINVLIQNIASDNARYQ